MIIVQNDYYQISEVELIYKPKFRASQRPTVTCSDDAHHMLRSLWDRNKINLLEEFKILLLNRGKKVIGISNISQGGVAGTIADPKIIFSTALKANASAIILAHNHPSGTLKPSVEDERLTSKLKEAAYLLDMQVVDHLILTEESYFSFADEGLCF